MKALILAAGLGTRLRPLTNNTPKCLVPVGNHPLLYYHLQNLSNFGINDILINTHYLSGKVSEFIDDQKLHFPNLHIETAYEKVLLGSAGTLKENNLFFLNEDDILVIYGDNLTNIDYHRFIGFHKKTNGIATIASYFEPHPETKGIIQMDGQYLISGFVEKPRADQISSHNANAGIYLFKKNIFDYLGDFDKTPLDFGFDIFPHLLLKQQKLHAYLMSEFLLDIGTIESYNFAQTKINELNFNV